MVSSWGKIQFDMYDTYMAQPPSIRKNHTSNRSASPSIPPCLHHLNHSWPRSCFGALGASLSLAKAPQPQKKVQKNTDNLTRTRKNTNHSANTDKDGKDIEFRVLVKQGHVVYELLFFMVWNGWVRRNLGGPLLHQKEVNIQVFTEIILPKKKHPEEKLFFKRGPPPLCRDTIRSVWPDNTLPGLKGFKVSEKKKSSFSWITK